MLGLKRGHLNTLWECDKVVTDPGRSCSLKNKNAGKNIRIRYYLQSNKNNTKNTVQVQKIDKNEYNQKKQIAEKG